MALANRQLSVWLTQNAEALNEAFTGGDDSDEKSEVKVNARMLAKALSKLLRSSDVEDSDTLRITQDEDEVCVRLKNKSVRIRRHRTKS
jgi:hypothetical protein